MIRNAVITAAVVGLFFLLVGIFMLQLMGISVGSFAIGGGIILLVLSVSYMISGRTHEYDKGETVAVVPIGTPLMVGPATITTLLLLGTQFPILLGIKFFYLKHRHGLDHLQTKQSNHALSGQGRCSGSVQSFQSSSGGCCC